MRRVFVHLLEEIEDAKKAFRNYLTFSNICTTFVKQCSQCKLSCKHQISLLLKAIHLRNRIKLLFCCFGSCVILHIPQSIDWFGSIKGCLILESFSIWLKPQKQYAKSLLSIFFSGVQCSREKFGTYFCRFEPN